jgi:hypothetical protein
LTCFDATKRNTLHPQGLYPIVAKIGELQSQGGKGEEHSSFPSKKATKAPSITGKETFVAFLISLLRN